jgi:hypothetical protein
VTKGPVERRAYGVRETAVALGISERMAWRLIRLGELRAFKLGSRTLIPVENLRTLIDERSAAEVTARAAADARWKETLAGLGLMDGKAVPARAEKIQRYSRRGRSVPPRVVVGDPLVEVRLQSDDGRKARYRLSRVEDIHWDHTKADGRRSNYWYLHGYVWCDAKEDGDLIHPCGDGAPRHRVRVCLTRKGNEAVFERLLEMCPGPPSPNARSAR